SSRSVDLPTPGSPAMRITAPGTSPPPSTRSSSATPVARARAASTSTSPMGTAGDPIGARAAVRGPAVGVFSATVPHAWHSPQRPTHLADVHPHSAQANEGRASLLLDMPRTLAATPDTPARGGVHR